MSEDPNKGMQQVRRAWEQPEDAPSFYAQTVQVTALEQEVVTQFYEVVPSSPGHDGKIESVRMRLRATIVLSRAHAAKLGTLLTQHATSPTP